MKQRLLYKSAESEKLSEQQSGKQIWKTTLILKQKTKLSLLKITLVVSALASVGIAGRSAMQFIPSVEPLTPLAIFTGFVFGPIAGIISGSAGFYISNNFVWGMQGPWTLFQCIGAGLAGAVGGIFGKIKKNSRPALLISTFIGIALYELIVSFGGFSFTLGLVPIHLYFMTSLPFSIVHIVSSLGFTLFIFEFRKHIKGLSRGVLVEKEIFGIRTDISDDSSSRNKPVPWFHYRELFRTIDNKCVSSFWHLRYKEQDNNHRKPAHSI